VGRDQVDLGHQPVAAIVSPVMAVNLDPKPGRWILPLVILGMIAFTYFFVRSLPEASPDTTLASGTTSIVVDGTTTAPPGDSGGDDATALYLAELDRINGELHLLDAELVAVNAGFDADPREIEFPEAESRMEAVAAQAQALADAVAALVPPAGLEQNQETLVAAITLAAQAANEALSGLQSTDPGDQRRAAVAAFTNAVANFDVEVENARTAAGVSPEA
jgi:hypothetical protein